jgi:hypothetical protein
MTIDIFPDGSISALYTEAIDLRELGALDVQRASNVEFDHDRQLWTVVVAGAELYASPARQACLDWEADNTETILDHARKSASGA